MTEPRIETQEASDGYPLHVAVWPSSGPPRGRVLVIHGVQSHSGWYHGLGRNLASAGFEAHFPDRLGLHAAPAGLLAASLFLDRAVRTMPPRVRQPAMLMLSGRDRIVDNAKTLKYFGRLACDDRRVIEYPEAHHTMEFEPDPGRY